MTISDIIEKLGGATKLSRKSSAFGTRQNLAMMKCSNRLPDKYSTRLAFDQVINDSQKFNPKQRQQALTVIWEAPDADGV
mgnify:FL=1|tara:strand:+ start:2435 stop:2674 length:240 start_codon:yes stop_codon:yes gene_type:complete